jgi:hypothetical protein
MERPDRIVFLALALAALVVIDLIKTLRTGRARSMWTGTFSREVIRHSVILFHRPEYAPSKPIRPDHKNSN